MGVANIHMEIPYFQNMFSDTPVKNNWPKCPPCEKGDSSYGACKVCFSDIPSSKTTIVTDRWTQ